MASALAGDFEFSTNKLLIIAAGQTSSTGTVTIVTVTVSAVTGFGTGLGVGLAWSGRPAIRLPLVPPLGR